MEISTLLSINAIAVGENKNVIKIKPNRYANDFTAAKIVDFSQFMTKVLILKN